MKKWIFLFIFNGFCFGGEPPFSDLQRKPSLSPYLRMSPDLDLPYHQNFNQTHTNIPQNQIIIQKNIYTEKKPSFNYDGIRPTGHCTYFMYIPYYNFR
jgi:hypothetical protein